MPTAIRSGMMKRRESRMALYLPMCRNEFRRMLAFGGSISNIAPRPNNRGEPMRYVSRSMATLAALLVLGVSVASAQHPQTRKGFWIGFGFGYGSYTCTACGSTGGVSGYLKMGGTVSPHLLLGGETNGWTKSEGGFTTTAGNASFTGYYYVQPAGGFFLRGGVGLSTVSISQGGSSASNSGLGATAGLG